MQELIKEWREFMIFWDVITRGDDDDKPTFFDFMQWLSDKYK